MISTALRRHLALAQVAAIDVVRLHQHADIEGAVRRCCTLASDLIGPVEDEEIADIAVIAKYMLDTHAHASQPGPTVQPQPAPAAPSAAPRPEATILRMIPGGRADDAPAAPPDPQASTQEHP